MEKNSIYCDKCGKPISNPIMGYCPNYALYNYSAKIQVWGVGVQRYTGGQRMDLCPACFEKFINWLEKEEE